MANKRSEKILNLNVIKNKSQLMLSTLTIIAALPVINLQVWLLDVSVVTVSQQILWQQMTYSCCFVSSEVLNAACDDSAALTYFGTFSDHLQ